MAFINSPELPEDDSERFLGFIGGVANHEAKLLTTAVILSRAGAFFTEEALAQEIIDRQGNKPAWPMSQVVPYQYCRSSLEPIGAVVKGEVMDDQGKLHQAYYANTEHLSQNLAMTGFLLDWSLRYPATSVQKLFSVSNSKSEARAPIARYQILRELLAAPDEPSMVDIQNSLELSYVVKDVSVPRSLRMLERAGILVTNSTGLGRNPSIKVTDPQYHSLKNRPFEDITPTAQAIYRTMQEVFDSGEEIDLEAFIRKVTEKDSTLDPPVIRRSLAAAGSGTKKASFKGLEIMRPQSGHMRSKIRISELHRDALEDLMEGLESVRLGQRHNELVGLALQIVTDPDAFNKLMAKARENSPHGQRANGAAKELRSFILSQMVDKPVTAPEVQKVILEKLGRSVDVDTVRGIARTMSKSGLIEIVEIHVGADSGRKRVMKAYKSSS